MEVEEYSFHEQLNLSFSRLNWKIEKDSPFFCSEICSVIFGLYFDGSMDK